MGLLLKLLGAGVFDEELQELAKDPNQIPKPGEVESFFQEARMNYQAKDEYPIDVPNPNIKAPVPMVFTEGYWNKSFAKKVRERKMMDPWKIVADDPNETHYSELIVVLAAMTGTFFGAGLMYIWMIGMGSL